MHFSKKNLIKGIFTRQKARTDFYRNACHPSDLFLPKIPVNSAYYNIFMSLRGAKRRGNPELKFKQNLKSGLPRHFVPRNDEMRCIKREFLFKAPFG
jgi:hypothetical protein